MPKEFSKQFHLSITKALRDQLQADLNTLTPAPLNEENLQKLHQRESATHPSSGAGVYQLYRSDPKSGESHLVYIGKAEKSISKRLEQHMAKISGRVNISLSEMSFKCLYVAEDLSAVAPEKILIKNHKMKNEAPWNNNGFGNKDPGLNRDKTILEADHFDTLFPIDLNRELSPTTPESQDLEDFLKELKEELPYNFRYKKSPIYENISITPPGPTATADSAFKTIIEALPSPWQIVALSGYVIMYDNEHENYASAIRYYRNGKTIDAKPKTTDEPKKKSTKKTKSGEEELPF
ncbi:hypothetical protein VSQ78_16345 [Nocardiopsis alba]|uniref:GIY-YIG domain-containing protein n=1 Tax=Nocardiopsis alba TaxID=53437 RepID=A0ABV5DXH0_9ACTN